MDLKPTLKFTNNLDVLYIDDNKILRESTQLLLGNFFSKVDVAKDGKEGLEIYKQYFQDHQKYYDLIISDIDMPRLNGLEMIKEIYKLNEEQPIIIVTASNDVDHFLEAINLGISNFMLKPFGMKKISKVLHRVCQSIYDRKFVLEHYYHKNDSVLSKGNGGHDYFMSQVEDLVSRDLAELVQLHGEMDKVLANILMKDFDIPILKSNLPKLSAYFNQYASVLSFYTFFDDLSKNMSVFSETLDVDLLAEQEDQHEDIFTLLESFLFVLKSWQNELATCDHSKIDYYNSSIINDMETISNMCRQRVREGEVEFF